MLRATRSSLFADLDVDVQPDAPIAQLTWYGLGGRADLLVRPRTVESLQTLVERCSRSGTPLRILGSGANLLIADEGIDGIVLRLDLPAFTGLKYDPRGEPNQLLAMAGADLPKTLMDAARRGLGGLEPLAGIPASIGGAIRMNAGGVYGSIGDTVISVSCLTRTGDRIAYPSAELRFDYRCTNIPDPIILAATFQLTPEDPITLRKRIKDIFDYKKSTQPLADHSAGCAFKNPIDPVTETRVSAGRLIDEAGLKGFAIGEASVSDRHANFIVARPGATARDVMALMEEVKRRVFAHCGLELTPEVAIWRRGEDDE